MKIFYSPLDIRQHTPLASHGWIYTTASLSEFVIGVLLRQDRLTQICSVKFMMKLLFFLVVLVHLLANPSEAQVSKI